MARPPKTPPPPTGPFVLTDSKDNFQSSMQGQLESGRKIEAGIASIRNESDFDNLKNSFQKWDDFNEAFLATAFTDDRKLKEYRGTSGALKITRDMRGQISNFKNSVAAKITAVESLLGQVGLFKETQLSSPTDSNDAITNSDKSSDANEEKELEKIFISHAKRDESFVDTFVHLLRNGLDISAQNIFCSSLPGHTIPPGHDFKDSIKKNFDESTVVIALISENFNASPFCWCEMGGVWVKAKRVIPMLIPPTKFADLKAVLQGLQALEFTESSLEELKDALEEATGRRVKGNIWNNGKAKFLKDMPEALKKITFDAPVPRAIHAKIEKDLQDFKSANEEQSEEIAKLQATIEQLKELKDKASVAKVLVQNSSDTDTFQTMVDDCQQKMRKFSRGIQRMFFLSFAGITFSVPRDDYDEFLGYKTEGLISIDDDDGTATLDDEDEDVAAADRALRELMDWMQECSSEFRSWYKQQYPGVRFDITKEPFWKEHLYY